MIIRILSGGYGFKQGNSFTLICRGETVDVPEAEAKNLIASGAAEAVDAAVPAHEEPAQEETRQLSDMTVAELRALAAELDVDVTGCKRKADFIARISGEEDSVDDGEAPPDISAEAPVV